MTEQLKARLFDLRKAGFNRLYQAGQVFEFSTPESLLDIRFDQPVFMLVDRLAISADARTRIVDAVSYTHLDVYKRQLVVFVIVPLRCWFHSATTK